MEKRSNLSTLNTSQHIGHDARYFLAAIVESSEDSIVTIDFNNIITSWNKGAERLYGYSASEVIDKSLTMLMLPEDIKQLLINVDRIKQQES